jgi:hypothetical protein
MKKIILTVSVVASSVIAAMAQGPDFSFESWNNVFGSTTVSDPVGWASLNTLVNFGGTQSVFKETTAPFAGLASAKITTVKVTGAAIPNPYASGNIDTAGILVIGTINFSPPGLKYGYSYASRPAVLSFESKYTPMTGDSAFVLAYLTKWNGTSRDTVATGKYSTGTATTTYSLNNITMTYKPAFASVIPDSERILISSSVYAHVGAKIGSAFYVDDFAWSGYNSVNNINGVVNTVSVYPNPASTTINFNCSVTVNVIEITDITGRLVGSYLMNDKKVTIQTSAFAPGIYMYNMVNDKKEIINRGKFEVVK